MSLDAGVRNTYGSVLNAIYVLHIHECVDGVFFKLNGVCVDRYNRPRSAMMCLLLLDDFSGAVQAALRIDPQLAKGIAAKHDEQHFPGVKKHLWLLIAKYVIEQDALGGDMRRPLMLIKESGHVLSVDVSIIMYYCVDGQQQTVLLLLSLD
jgi:hypothetical protein